MNSLTACIRIADVNREKFLFTHGITSSLAPSCCRDQSSESTLLFTLITKSHRSEYVVRILESMYRLNVQSHFNDEIDMSLL